MAAGPTTLELRLHGGPIGSLTRLPGGITVLSFDDDYVQDDHRATLSLGFLDAFERVRRPKPSTNGEVPPFFANLLPEADLRRYVAQRAGISNRDDFALLWVTGDDLPGAVTLHDAVGACAAARRARRPGQRASAAGTPLVLARRRATEVQRARKRGRGPDRSRAGARRALDREASVAAPRRGARERVRHAAVRRGRGHRRTGNPPGCARRDRGASAGSCAAHRARLAIRRFDQGDGDARIHIEDFNQIFRQQPREKYDDFAFAHLRDRVSGDGERRADDFIGRLVFNIGIANGDMHLKNWSVIYETVEFYARPGLRLRLHEGLSQRQLDGPRAGIGSKLHASHDRAIRAHGGPGQGLLAAGSRRRSGNGRPHARPVGR